MPVPLWVGKRSLGMTQAAVARPSGAPGHIKLGWKRSRCACLPMPAWMAHMTPVAA